MISLFDVVLYVDGSFSPSNARQHRVLQKKLGFFFILTISSLFDIPLYAECIRKGGPPSCEWDSASYSNTWILHLVALCGYCMTLAIPPIMWSEIIQSRWVMSSSRWNACSPHFNVAKYVIALSIVLYFITEWCGIFGMIFDSEIRHPDAYEAGPLNKATSVMECLFILMQIMTWLWVGLALHFYVVGVRFERQDQQRILRKLNITMVVITVCYCVRAFFVLVLATEKAGHEIVMKHYLLWVVATRWLPYILGSLLLAFLMRKKTPSTKVNKYQHLPDPTKESIPYMEESSDLQNSMLWNNIEEAMENEDNDDDIYDEDVIGTNPDSHSYFFGASGGFFRGFFRRASTGSSSSTVDGGVVSSDVSIHEIRNLMAASGGVIGSAGGSLAATGGNDSVRPSLVDGSKGPVVLSSTPTSATALSTGSSSNKGSSVSNAAERNYSVSSAMATSPLGAISVPKISVRAPTTVPGSSRPHPHHGSFSSVNSNTAMQSPRMPPPSSNSSNPDVAPLNEWSLQQHNTIQRQGSFRDSPLAMTAAVEDVGVDDDETRDDVSTSTDKLLSFLTEEYDFAAIHEYSDSMRQTNK
jgi:predicted regulator of Ras-like GTPase activity (Roadblock/LC7/MglB family)